MVHASNTCNILQSKFLKSEQPSQPSHGIFHRLPCCFQLLEVVKRVWHVLTPEVSTESGSYKEILYPVPGSSPISFRHHALSELFHIVTLRLTMDLGRELAYMPSETVQMIRQILENLQGLLGPRQELPYVLKSVRGDITASRK